MTIDPITFARFMVLKGAAELVDSFSAIPEGYLRDSIVHHAQALAQTYNEARASGAPIPDPLDLAARAPQRLAAASAPLALPSSAPKINGHDKPAQAPPRGKVKLDTVETQAVRLRMAGKTPGEIAQALEVDVAEVSAALGAARRAGVKFKALPKAPIGERPTSNNWNTDWAKMPVQARTRVEQAAASLGLDPESYLDRKAKLLRMRQAREPWAEIVKACKPVKEEALWRWVYQARAAGYDIPGKLNDDTPVDADFEPVPEPRRYFPPYDAMNRQERVAVERAALRRSISPEAYAERREYIIHLRMEGKGHVAITALTGESGTSVKDILTHAKHRWGVDFPPVARGEGAPA